MESKSFNWDAADFFRRLTETNKLARSKNFKFCLVSSLEGFEEALARMHRFDQQPAYRSDKNSVFRRAA